ncbi:MAG: guanylate kinase [Elusimicrobiota bacterium]|jgi:guanylate kinase|nr:guanylate kinase [Elusimicrobiota bacterium]
MKKKGHIIVISAPSGAGKTSICKEILKSSNTIVYSISYTTRKPRDKEKNGVEYYFITENKFVDMINDEKFAEWAKVYDNYYGTPKNVLQKTIDAGKNILLEIDVQGAMDIKKVFPQACMIFIKVPNIKILRERLIKRGQDSVSIIKKRIANVKSELRFINKYDYIVVNDNLEESIEAVKIIIMSLQYKVG